MTAKCVQTARSNFSSGEALATLVEEIRRQLPFEAIHLAAGGRWFPRTMLPEHPLRATGKIASWRLNWGYAPLSRWQAGTVRCQGKQMARLDYRLRVGAVQWHIVLIGTPPAPSPEVLEELTELLHSVLTPKRTEQLLAPAA